MSLFGSDGDIGIRLTLFDEASAQLDKAKQKMNGMLNAIKGSTLLDAKIIGTTFTRYGSMATNWSEGMLKAYADVDAATAQHLANIDTEMKGASASMGEAMAPSMLAMKGAAADLAEGLSRLPQPLREVVGSMVYVGGVALTAGGNILQMAASLGKMAEMGWITKASMVQVGLAMGATMLIVAALTTDSDELRLVFSALSAVLIVYTARKWMQNAADYFGVSIWTMGVGAAIALTAAIAGITYMMHQSQQASQESAVAMVETSDTLDTAAAKYGLLGSNINATSYLAGQSLLSLGGLTTNTIGQMWGVTNDGMGKIYFKVTDTMGNVYSEVAEKMEGTENQFKDRWGNIYTVSENELGQVLVKVQDVMGNTYTVTSDAVTGVSDDWTAVWSALGNDDSGVLSNFVAAVSQAGTDAGDTFGLGMAAGIDAGLKKANGLIAQWAAGEPGGGGWSDALFGTSLTDQTGMPASSQSGAVQTQESFFHGPVWWDPSTWFDDVIMRPGQAPIGISPDDTVLAYKGDTPPISGGGGGINIFGDIHITAGTYEGGQQAARGFREELLRRGVQFTR